ncbi:hypothetical protein BKA56DRAFT_613742 [Ilyonectria sp. MPI-CAGE-AT-0026]|nr:hypothetical protein BKA56DRAFT_613742 [Ilyonectria sp. MPI-CAGE-AT-0026]
MIFLGMKYMESASYASDYVEFIKKYHPTCISLGTTWLGGVRYGDYPIIWRIKNSQGGTDHEAHRREWRMGWGGVWSKQSEWENAPLLQGTDAWSLWDVLHAESGLKAIDEGRFEDWKLEEKEHRREAEMDIWVVNSVGASLTVGTRMDFTGRRRSCRVGNDLDFFEWV